MNGLPANFDASVFLGKDLILVSFTQNTAHFSFDDDRGVTVESSFSYRPGPGAAESEQSVPVASSDVMRLLGRKVTRAEPRADGSLRLEFEGGGAITFLDDSAEYESYHLHIGSEQIDV
jgi:hypothetical protein